MNAHMMRDKRSVRLSRLMLSSLIIIILAWSAYARNVVWQTDLALLEDEASKSPNKGRTHVNLGRAYDLMELQREALEQYLIATTVEPDYAKAHESLGIKYMSFRQTELARQQFELALRLEPELREANAFLAYILKQKQ